MSLSELEAGRTFNVPATSSHRHFGVSSGVRRCRKARDRKDLGQTFCIDLDLDMKFLVSSKELVEPHP